MRRLVRAVMAISLIAGDAAHAASLTEAPGGAGQHGQRVQARFQDLIDHDTATWKRLSASICRGCGDAPPPLEITRTAPLPVRDPRAAIAAAPDPGANAGRPAKRSVSLRSAGLQARAGDRRGGPRAGSTPVRLTAQARRYARSARLRTFRPQRRLALLGAQRKRYARLAPEGGNQAHRPRLAGLAPGFRRREADSSGGRRPVPLPLQRPDALCADDRGLAAVRIRPVSACIEPR